MQKKSKNLNVKKNKFGQLFVLFVLTGMLNSSCFGQEQKEQHPSLFFSKDDLPALRAKIESDTWIGKAWKVLKARADVYMDIETNPYSYTDEHTKIGIAARAMEKRAGILAFVGQLTGEKKYMRKAADIVISSAIQSDPNQQEYWVTHLQVGDAARAYSVVYDWVYEVLQPDEQKLLRDEIYKFGKWLYEANTVWGKPDLDVSACNHNSIHYGGMGLCALVLGDKPVWEKRATERIRAYLKYSMDSTGYCGEGHGYANYGLSGALPYSCALQRRGGPDLVEEQPSLKWMTDQFIWKLLPWGRDFLPLNDNPFDCGSAGMTVYFISRYKQPDALWSWLRAVGEDGSNTYGMGINGYEGDSMSAPYAIIWGDPSLEPVSPAKTGRKLSHKFESGRVFARDSWEDVLGSLVSFTSGCDYHMAHNHHDENSFTFYTKGESFAIDPPYQPNEARSHNTFLINGVGQIVANRGRIIDYSDCGDAVYAKGQASEAYRWSVPLVRSFQRQVLFGRAKMPYLLVVDELQSETDEAAVFTWLLHTDKDNSISIDSGKKTAQITGKNHGAVCEVMFLNGNIALSETNFGDEVFKRKGHYPYYAPKYSELYREIRAEAKAVEFELVTLLIARDANEKTPEIICSGEGIAKKIQIDFGDYRDMLELSSDKINFSRIKKK